MQFKITKTEEEISLCYKLRHIIFVEGQNVPLERERDAEDKIAVHFLLYQDTIPVGIGRLVQKNSTAIIGRVGILKEHRGNGAGLLLMQKIISYCRKSDFQRVVLGAQEHALDFYRKLGFQVCGERYMDANIPHFKMELLLK